MTADKDRVWLTRDPRGAWVVWEGVDAPVYGKWWRDRLSRMIEGWCPREDGLPRSWGVPDGVVCGLRADLAAALGGGGPQAIVEVLPQERTEADIRIKTLEEAVQVCFDRTHGGDIESDLRDRLKRAKAEEASDGT